MYLVFLLSVPEVGHPQFLRDSIKFQKKFTKFQIPLENNKFEIRLQILLSKRQTIIILTSYGGEFPFWPLPPIRNGLALQYMP